MIEKVGPYPDFHHKNAGLKEKTDTIIMTNVNLFSGRIDRPGAGRMGTRKPPTAQTPTGLTGLCHCSASAQGQPDDQIVRRWMLLIY
jgi:hypothetical protein